MGEAGGGDSPARLDGCMDWPVDDLGLTVLLPAWVSCSPPDACPVLRCFLEEGTVDGPAPDAGGVSAPPGDTCPWLPLELFAEASVGRLLHQRAPEATTFSADMCVFLV